MITFYAGANAVTARAFRLASGFTLGEDTDGLPIIGGGGGGGGSSNILGSPHTSATANLSMYMATPDQQLSGVTNVGFGTTYIDFSTFASDLGTWSATRSRPPMRWTARQFLWRTDPSNGENNPGSTALFINESQQVSVGHTNPVAGRRLTIGGDALTQGNHYVTQQVISGPNGLGTNPIGDAGIPLNSGAYTGVSAVNAPVVGTVTYLVARHDQPTANRQLQLAAAVGNGADLYYRSIDAASLTSVSAGTSPWYRVALREGTTGALVADQGAVSGVMRFMVRTVVSGEALSVQMLVYIETSTGKVRRASADVVGLTPNLYMTLDSAASADQVIRVAPISGLFLDTAGFSLGQRVYLATGGGNQYTSTAPTTTGATVILLGQVARVTTGGAMALALQPTFLYVVG